MSVIPATWEAEIRRIMVQGQLGQINQIGGVVCGESQFESSPWQNKRPHPKSNPSAKGQGRGSSSSVPD
jgi:hypothetical protein